MIMLFQFTVRHNALVAVVWSISPTPRNVGTMWGRLYPFSPWSKFLFLLCYFFAPSFLPFLFPVSFSLNPARCRDVTRLGLGGGA